MFDTNYDTHTQYLKDLERQVGDARKNDFKFDLNGPVGWFTSIVGLIYVIVTALPEGMIV